MSLAVAGGDGEYGLVDELETMICDLECGRIGIKEAIEVVRLHSAPPSTVRAEYGDFTEVVPNDMSAVSYAKAQGRLTKMQGEALWSAWYTRHGLELPAALRGSADGRC